jgi:hypothetical protein
LWPRIGLALDGKELLKTCTNFDVMSQTFCLGYITGIADTLGPKSGSSLVCIASGGRPDQLRRAIVKYLRDHPENGFDSADILSWTEWAAKEAESSVMPYRLLMAEHTPDRRFSVSRPVRPRPIA